MNAVREVAQAVKILAAVTAIAIAALCVVDASTVPDWCDATKADYAAKCVNTNPK